MGTIKRLGFGVIGLILVSLMLAACGENTATPLPTPRVVPSNTATTASAAPAKIISENDSDSTLRLKVGDSVLVGFNPEMNWNFELEPNSGAKTVLAQSAQPAPQPYQAKYEAQAAGTVNLKAQGSCRPKPGEICNNAIFIYNVTVTVS